MFGGMSIVLKIKANAHDMDSSRSREVSIPETSKSQITVHPSYLLHSTAAAPPKWVRPKAKGEGYEEAIAEIQG